MSFKFGLKQYVVIVRSKEQGTIVGRAEYVTAKPMYLLQYKDASGSAREAWFSQTELSAA